MATPGACGWDASPFTHATSRGTSRHGPDPGRVDPGGGRGRGHAIDGPAGHGLRPPHHGGGIERRVHASLSPRSTGTAAAFAISAPPVRTGGPAARAGP